MTKQELLDKANDLPLAPGVYLMMDKTGCVIYVGKAKKLKNRVSQYFQENSSHNEKTRRMVSQVDHFDTIFVSTEFEALILENSLIKQHMPRYNILLKDDKGYPFVRLGTEHYPRFTMVGKPADDNALYFGPFGGRNETRAAIDAICAAFRLPTCSRKFPRDIGKDRPCLNHHMGRCDAFCRGTPDEDEYMRRIGQAEELLNGHYRRLTRALREEMEQEAADLHFEQAAALRDRIRAIEVLGKRQKVIAGICADTDVWGVYRGALKCGSAVLHIEDGSVTGRDLNLFAAPQDESEQMILSALLPQYYLNKSVLPREILLPCEIEGADELAQILTERAGRKVTLHVPQRGEKAELLAMAQRNAREDVERVTTAQERENRTLTQLAGMLSLPELPGRMESYDISNTGASDIVASMVVYEGAKPKKSAYRRFKIKSLSAHPDDYASMEEVLTRRIQRYLDGDEKFSPLPDVMLIDGGITPYQLPYLIRKLLLARDMLSFKLAVNNRKILEAAFPPERFTLPGHDPKKEYDAIEAYLKTYSDQTIRNIFWSGNNYVLPKTPAKIGTKITYWYGDEEKKNRRSNIRFIKHYFPQARIHGIPKMAHAELVMIYPEEFCRYFDKFMCR